MSIKLFQENGFVVIIVESKAKGLADLITSAGKRARIVVVKSGKTCTRCEARENLEAWSSAGKRAAGSRRGKTSCNNSFQGQETSHTI